MSLYIHQLLEDLAALIASPVQPPNYKLLYPNHPALEHDGYLDYIVSWECGVDEPMEKVFGIVPEAFPPPEHLTEEQATQLCEAILDVWAAHRIHANIPSNVPTLIIYGVLRKSWAEDGIHLITDGVLHQEFCNFEPKECPWGSEYCECAKYNT